MIVRLENLYINTDNIVTISNYEILDDGNIVYEAGIVINGDNHPIYRGDGKGNPNPEQRQEICDKTSQLVKTIVNNMAGAGTLSQQVIKELQFDKTLSFCELKEIGLHKEQLND